MKIRREPLAESLLMRKENADTEKDNYTLTGISNLTISIQKSDPYPIKSQPEHEKICSNS